MPLYRYECSDADCAKIFQKKGQVGVDSIDCKYCGKEAVKLAPQTSEPTVKVVIDKFRGKSVLRNINNIMKKRSRDYQKKYELGEMVSKYGIDSIKKNSSFLDPETGKKKTVWEEK